MHVKLNKEDKGEGGGAGLVVRESDSEREFGCRSSLGSLCCVLEQDKFTPQKCW